MTAAAQRIHPSTMPAPADDDDDREEITIERRVKAQALPTYDATRKTTRMTKLDSRLLAIARGELDPEDPFGGLIPIYENDDESAIDIEDTWLVLGQGTDVASSTDEGILSDTVPTLLMRAHDLLTLGLEPRCTFFVSQIDGIRTVQELASICALDDLSVLKIVDELLRVGAIDLH